ncbi:Holliday junction resolvase [Bacteroides phage B40-8]|uniref:Holliday junction resolvase n=1 Tax=Bacteroides phage B40-8 TaxID=99179 RepID=UPI00017FB65F|nr:Holliday junction resolvase [Bacteroides phage B40-8]ACH81961.1 conserved hypothetical protein [Bacteroides phage B40-8]
MEINILVGIDPGVSAGGIAIYKPNNPLVTVKMPDEPLDIFRLFRKIKRSGNPMIVVERLSIRGDDTGGKQYRIVTMLENFNYLVCCAKVLEIPLVLVTPMTWQKNLGLRAKGEKEDKAIRKEKYYQFAKHSFPFANVHKWNSDAACILRFTQLMIANKPKWIKEHLINCSDYAFSVDLRDDSAKYYKSLSHE